MTKKELHQILENNFLLVLSLKMCETFELTKDIISQIHYEVYFNRKSLNNYSDFLIKHYENYLNFLQINKNLLND